MYEAFVSLCSPSLCLRLHIHICLSSGTVTQIPARMCLSGYVTDYCLAQDCVCMTVCRVCVCNCVRVNVCLAALHALRSPLSFLPLMLFPVVCKLLH